MWKLRSFMKPYWIACLLAPLLMVVEVAMDLLQPRLMASIVDEGVMTGDLAYIQKTGLLMIGAAIIGLLGGVGCTVFSTIASQNFGRDLRVSLFEHIQALSFRSLDRLTTGSLITRLTNDVVQLQTFSMMILRMFVRTPLLLVGSLVMAFIISPKLTLIIFAAMPVLMAALVMLIRRSFPLFGKMQSRLDVVNTVLQENLTGIRVVKAFVRSRFEESRFNKANEDYTEVAVKAIRLMALNLPIMTFVLNASIVAVLWFGGLEHWNGGIPVGSLIAFINYVTQLMMSLLMIGGMLAFVSRAKVSADRVNSVFAEEPEIKEHADALQDAVRSGRVQFDHVSFSYNGNQEDMVLQDISFTAEPGQTVVILGATGSGKSSLVNLIPRFYDVSSGAIRIDGTDIRQIALNHLRSRIGLVMQKALLFSGTIRDNIKYGSPEASEEEVIRAAKAAQAHDFIAGLPAGYDTELGQRGVNLSGGQKQRISIARALLARPAILILDDSMSAVDLRTEARIRHSLQELMKKTTNIVIAQRLTSAEQADIIIVLEEGRIAARGTHDELLRTSPIYQEIYRSQHKEGGEARASAN